MLKSDNTTNLSTVISDIQENILIKLFGSEHVNIKTLLLMTSQIVEQAHEYEFEMRYVDEGGSVSRDTWIKFNRSFNDELNLISYDDDVIYTHQTNVPLNDIRFRSYKNSNKSERKMNISRILARPESRKTLPLSVRLSRETPMSPVIELHDYDNIQRRQRYTYKFNDPTLSNWRIDKTIRFFTEDINDKKLSFKLEADNVDTLKYYDSLDIEFEYIGDYSMICIEFFRLIGRLYTPFEDFDMRYNFIRHFFVKNGINFENIFALIPQPVIMTNGIMNNINVNDFSYSYRINGEHVILAVIINRNHGDSILKSDILILSIADEYLKHVYGSLDIFIKEPVDDAYIDENKIIPRRLMNFIMPEDKTISPLVYVFEAESISDDNSFILLDTLLYKSKNMMNNILTDRLSCLDKFLKLENKFIRKHISKNEPIDLSITSTNHIISALHKNSTNSILDTSCIVCKQIEAPLSESLVYKIKKDISSLSIDFKICYVQRKKSFYLYTTGYIRNVIKEKTILNDMSIEHFGYSLINMHSNKEVYLLFVSPYMKNSHIFKPRKVWDDSAIDEDIKYNVNILMSDILECPMRYNHVVMKMIRVSDGWVPITVCGYTNDYLDYINRNSSIVALTKSFLSCPSFVFDSNSSTSSLTVDNNISRSSSYSKIMDHLAIPHTYHEALNISSLLYDNINSRNIHISEQGRKLHHSINSFNSRGFMTSAQLVLVKSLYTLIDQYIVERYMNDYNYYNILDIFNEEHIIVSLIYGLSKCKHIYGVNSDKGILSSYIDAGVFRNNNGTKSITPLMNKTHIHSTNTVLNMNIIDSDINSLSLLYKLNEQCEYFPKSIDLIILHNNFKSLDSIIEFIEFRNICLNVLSPNGKILIIAHDGDKIINLLNCQSRNNRIYIEEVCINNHIIIKTNDDTVVPSPESIYSINNTLNDRYQYEHRNIKTVPSESNSHINVSCNSTAHSEFVDIRYKQLHIKIIPPSQYENLDINDLGIVAMYYFKFNRFVANNTKRMASCLTFRSQKLISKMMTLNIAHVLNIKIELCSNIYDKCLSEWYSIYHNVDKLFGSSGYTQDVIINGIHKNILIEIPSITSDIKRFLQSRYNIEFTTTIITEQSLCSSELKKFKFSYIKRIQNNKRKVYIYIYYSNMFNDLDARLISLYLDEVINNENTLLFRYYTHPNIVKHCMEPTLIFKREFLRIFNTHFKVCDYCVPIIQSEVSTFISYNRKFSKLEEVEDYMGSIVVYVLEKNDDIY